MHQSRRSICKVTLIAVFCVNSSSAVAQTRGQDRLEAMAKGIQSRQAEQLQESRLKRMLEAERSAQRTRDNIIEAWNRGDRNTARATAQAAGHSDLLGKFNQIEAEEALADADTRLAEGVIFSEQHGDWQVVQKNTLCLMRRTYPEGEAILAEVDVSKNALDLTLSSPNWLSLKDTKAVVIDTQFNMDQKSQEEGLAFVYEEGGTKRGAINLSWKANTHINRIASSQMVEFWINNRSLGIYQIDLNGAGRAALSRCVEAQKSRLRKDPFR